MEQDGIPTFISALVAAIVLGAIVIAGIVLLAVFTLL